MRKIGTAIKNSNLLRLTHEIRKEDGTIIKKEVLVKDSNRILLWVVAILGILIVAGFAVFKINFNIFLTH